jgi:hypothetical protein
MSARSVADRISAPYAHKNGDELRSYQVEKGSQKDGRGYLASGGKGPRAAQRDASNDVGAAQNQEQADGCPSHMRILLLLDAVALLLGMAEKSSASAALPYRRRRSRKSMSLISYPAASRASMTSSLTVTWRLAASSRNLAAK